MKEKFCSFVLCFTLGLGSLSSEEDREQRREGDARRESPKDGDRARERENERPVFKGDREGERRLDRDPPRKPGVRGEGDRRPPPPHLRRDADREGGDARPTPREGDRPRPPFVRRDGEDGRNRPPFRPPFNREGAGRDRSPPPHLREGDRPSPELQREAQRREVMIQVLRDELRVSQQLNAELRHRMQLLEQRLSKLEKR